MRNGIQGNESNSSCTITKSKKTKVKVKLKNSENSDCVNPGETVKGTKTTLKMAQINLNRQPIYSKMLTSPIALYFSLLLKKCTLEKFIKLLTKMCTLLLLKKYKIEE